MEKYFITTAVPNGFKIENNKHKLCLSICLDLDIAHLLQKDKEADLDYQTRLQDFFTAFNQLTWQNSVFNVANIVLKIDGVDYKDVKLENALQNYCNPKDIKDIKKYLWENLFENGTKKIADTSKITQGVDLTGNAIESLSDYLPILNGMLGQTVTPEKTLRNHYKASNAYSEAKNQIATNDNLKSGLLAYKALAATDISTIRSQFRNLSATGVADFVANREKVFEKFFNLNVDPEEFINTFSSLHKNVVLKRLLGFVIDVSVEVPDKFIPIIDKGTRKFNVQATFNSLSCNNLIVPIIVYRLHDKYAYLIENSNPYFNHSLLNDQLAELLLFDKVAQEEKLQQHKERKERGEEVKDEEVTDSFTRGILYSHPELKKIIKIVAYTRDDSNNINETVPYDEDFHLAGQRVAVHVKSATPTKPFLSSITNRSFVLKDKTGKKFINCDEIEGHIAFDALGTKVETDGSVKHTTADVLFEWSGQQLTLKSAFSKASTTSKLDHLYEKINNQHDDGLWKSELKAKRHLIVDTFPYQEQDPNEPIPEISLLYGLPRMANQKIPRLLYGKTYSFVVYHEYKNGWGLPLSATNGSQLSVEDLLDPTVNFSKEVTFRSLENIKPLKFIHTQAVSEEEVAGIPLQDKESLDHLIVRSDSAEDSKQFIAKRHLTPDRSSLEKIFWEGAIFSEEMSAADSYKWKTKYNCPFHSRKDYQDHIGGGKSCPEKCTSYCGGTHIESYYSAGPIQPNYLTDPQIKGFMVKLFWDKAHTLPLKESKVIMFKGPEVRPYSYFIKANGAVTETEIYNNTGDNTLELRLKKGAELHAQVITEISPQAKSALALGWWKDVKMGPAATNFFLNEALIERRNIPKNFMLTHAVRQPLFSPIIFNLFSKPSKGKIDHVISWLPKLPAYKYELDKNIIAERTTEKPNVLPVDSTFAQVNLRSRFERLDMMSKLNFLKDIIPTGALEIWMRKEDFVDDPDQFVIRVNGIAENRPDKPVLSFGDRENRFTLEHKIEFSSAIMAQLKSLNNLELDDKINDAFKAVITTLNLNYDFKTCKFEEREYYLKNISKYKGYFTNEKVADGPGALSKLEPYVLPKLADVLNDEKFRFRAIILNNMRPKVPKLAYAGTTIQETRYYNKKSTNAEQKGNIITCYLKRGRLSSGKNERIGIIIEDLNAVYNDFFKKSNWISKAGRDILSDRYANGSLYLKQEHVNIKSCKYDAGYDKELGIIHYLPKFDDEKQLWKFEVELNITTANGEQLHNPFVNLSLVHFQPYSINYNMGTVMDWEKDCRISPVETSTWGYLLPERKLSVYFDKPGFLDNDGFLDATLTFDYQSLHQLNHEKDINGREWLLRSNFILTVEGALNEKSLIWEPINSINTAEKDAKPALHHPLLHPLIHESPGSNQAKIHLEFDRRSTSAYTDKKDKYKEVRIRLIEIEWFSFETWEEVLVRYEDLLTKGDILNREEFRIRYIELIY